MSMQQHFVTFFSPGTFLAESTTKPVDSWDLDVAREMAGSIVERYGTKPYAFQFLTRAREDDELDSRVVARSCRYYLGGKVETMTDVEARADPKDAVLLSNMRCNGYDRVITSPRGWTQPLEATAVVLCQPPGDEP